MTEDQLFAANVKVRVKKVPYETVVAEVKKAILDVELGKDHERKPLSLGNCGVTTPYHIPGVQFPEHGSPMPKAPWMSHLASLQEAAENIVTWSLAQNTVNVDTAPQYKASLTALGALITKFSHAVRDLQEQGPDASRSPQETPTITDRDAYNTYAHASDKTAEIMAAVQGVLKHHHLGPYARVPQMMRG